LLSRKKLDECGLTRRDAQDQIKGRCAEEGFKHSLTCIGFFFSLATPKYLFVVATDHTVSQFPSSDPSDEASWRGYIDAVAARQ
jgi:hypothetical protein